MNDLFCPFSRCQKLYPSTDSASRLLFLLSSPFIYADSVFTSSHSVVLAVFSSPSFIFILFFFVSSSLPLFQCLSPPGLNRVVFNQQLTTLGDFSFWCSILYSISIGMQPCIRDLFTTMLSTVQFTHPRVNSSFRCVKKARTYSYSYTYKQGFFFFFLGI